MNQVFDFRRFTLLVSKHWSENRKKYLLGIGAMIGLLVFWFGFVLIVDSGRRIPNELQSLTYYIGLAITGCFYGSILFADISSGPKAMSYLSFPASHLEKLACGLLYGVIVFFLVYTVAFYVVDIPMALLGDSLAPARILLPGEQKPPVVVNVFARIPGMSHDAQNPFILFVLGYIAVQSAYILGSVYFPKFSFLKTTIALLVVALLIAFFLSKVMTGILPDNHSFRDLTSIRIYNEDGFGGSKIVALPEWVNTLLTVFVKFSFAPIFWIVTYFRFKEKQV